MRNGRLTRTMETVLVVAAVATIVIAMVALLLGHRTVALVIFRATSIMALAFLVIVVADLSRSKRRRR